MHGEPANEDVLSSEPLIPPKLLTKLVHHHFRNEKTKMAKDANGVVAKYIDVFVREAVARAAFERAEGGGGGGVADGFLEVRISFLFSLPTLFSPAIVHLGVIGYLVNVFDCECRSRILRRWVRNLLWIFRCYYFAPYRVSYLGVWLGWALGVGCLI